MILPLRKNYPTTEEWADALCRYLEDKEVEVDSKFSSHPPIGLQAKWPHATIFPEGWLKCDGGTYTTSRYPLLALILGFTTATFTVPNVAGDIIRAD